MAEPAEREESLSPDDRLRLSDVTLRRPTPSMGPLTDPVDRVRREWTFIAMLIRPVDRREGAITLAIGLTAFLLGSLS